MEDSTYEAVNHPKHYTSHPSGIECKDVAQHHNFNIGNAIKYLWRQGIKPGEASSKDLRKAIKYIEFEIERIEGTEEKRCVFEHNGTSWIKNTGTCPDVKKVAILFNDKKTTRVNVIPSDYDWRLLNTNHSILGWREVENNGDYLNGWIENTGVEPSFERVDVTFSNNCSALNQVTKTLDWTISTSQYSVAYWKPANG